MATRTTQTEVCAMWRKKSKEGKSYFDGRLSSDLNPMYLKGFINGKKKNPNEPDIRIYFQNENKLGNEFISLWQKKSDKTGVVYFTGKLSEHAPDTLKGKNVVAFVGDHTNEKAPWFKVYLQNEVKQAKNAKTSNKQTPVVEEFEEDLAF